MESYNLVKTDLLQISQDLADLFSRSDAITGEPEPAFEDWEKTCREIHRQMTDEILRVAVVGTIKSGKSTFVNSLFKGDFLNRGAGVITSIVTRIRKGKSLKATLFFKSWDEVNADMQQAMVLFPSLNWRSEDKQFDIRREKDRSELQTAVKGLNTEHLITNDTHNVNSILLKSYLKGYERVKDIVSSDIRNNQFNKHRFFDHKDFVGDDALAAYLRDIQLQIDSGSLDPTIEIADCQGSDSPNPLHLAMIQDYLLVTHLIVYVISSRTGLRQADIRFLLMIKRMGIIDNILFVVNADFSEHENTGDLQTLVEKVREELSLIKPDPEIFTLSSLLNLFRNQPDRLSEKDTMRLKQWESAKEMVSLSDESTKRFETYFNHKLTKERFSLLLKNQLERMALVVSGLDRWVALNRDILTRDSHDAKDMVSKISHRQKRVNQIKAMIKSTLDGGAKKIRGELQNDVNRFFDFRSDDIFGEIVAYIRNYKVSFQKYEENLVATGFTNTLYLVFLEFKQSLDAFMTESINPVVIRFVKKEEKRILDYFQSIVEPYDVMTKEALEEYGKAMEGFGIAPVGTELSGVEVPDLDSVKTIIGLSLPPAVAAMRYTAKIKTEAILRLGFYRVVKLFKMALKKTIEGKNEDEIFALKDGVLRMKRETEKSIVSHFKDYKENIKFQYLFKLIEGVSNSLYDALIDRFQAHATDLTKISELISNKQLDKQQALDILAELARETGNIDERIQAAREKIDAIV